MPKIKNPFNVSFAEFQNLSPDESEKLLAAAYELCKGLIRNAWADGYRQIVICDGKLIYKTLDDEPVAAEKIKRLAKERGKACYVFSAPDRIEETVSASVTDDFHATPETFGVRQEASGQCLPVFAGLGGESRGGGN